MPYFEDNGVKINYLLSQQFPESKPLLVFLHEGLGSIKQWKNFYEELALILKLDYLVYEREGYGKSSSLRKSRDDNYLHEAALDEMPKVIQALAPNRKLILFGHSDGGTIALLYASKYSHVEAVITEAAHVFVEDETLAGIQPAIKAFEAGKLDKLRVFHGDKTETIFYAWAKTWLNPSFKNWDICKDIESITCPVLAIQGENDEYGTVKQLERIKKHVEGNCKYVMLSNCGHAPHISNKDEVIDLVKTFIDE